MRVGGGRQRCLHAATPLRLPFSASFSSPSAQFSSFALTHPLSLMKNAFASASFLTCPVCFPRLPPFVASPVRIRTKSGPVLVHGALRHLVRLLPLHNVRPHGPNLRRGGPGTRGAPPWRACATVAHVPFTLMWGSGRCAERGCAPWAFFRSLSFFPLTPSPFLRHLFLSPCPSPSPSRQGDYSNVADVWAQFAAGYLPGENIPRNRLLVVRYEDLVLDPAGELRRVERMLGRKVPRNKTYVVPDLKASKNHGRAIPRVRAALRLRTSYYKSEWASMSGAARNSLLKTLSAKKNVLRFLNYSLPAVDMDSTDKVRRAVRVSVVIVSHVRSS